MTQPEFNYIENAFSQIIDDIAGNPDWHGAASAVASNLGILERQLKEKVVELPSELDEAADTFAHNGDMNGVGGDDYEDDLRSTFKAGAEWMARQGVQDSIEGTICGRVHDHVNVKFPDWIGQTLEPKSVSHIPANVKNYNIGDAVIVQIRKKQ